MNTNLRIMFAPVADFGKVNTVAVHQKLNSIRDADDALDGADRSGFPCIVFYVPVVANLDVIRYAASLGKVSNKKL